MRFSNKRFSMMLVFFGKNLNSGGMRNQLEIALILKNFTELRKVH